MKPEERLIHRLTTIFGEPRTEDPAAYLEEFENAVKGYDADALEEAGTMIIRRSKFWPRPAEIIEQIEQLLRAKAVKSRKPKVVVDLPPPTPEALARAKALTEMAVAAMSANRPTAPDPVRLPPMNQPAFQDMQRRSFNRALHVNHQALAKRITGERD